MSSTSADTVTQPSEVVPDNLMLVNEVFTLVHNSRQRGHVYRRDDESSGPISRSFDFPKKVSVNELSSIPIEELMFQRMCEGTIVRVGYDPKSSRQFFTTHRNLDARRASWGARQFGVVYDQFVAPILASRGIDFSSPELSGLTFVLLLQDPENKQVCQMQLGAVHLTTLRPTDTGFERIEVDLGLPKPETVQVSSYEQLNYVVESIDPLVNSGVVALYRDPTRLDTFNIYSDKWIELTTARNNNPHLVKRYLELDTENSQKLRDKLTALFPEYSDLLKPGLYYRLLPVCRELANVFVKRTVHRLRIIIAPHAHKFLMTRVNPWYQQRRRARLDQRTLPLNQQRHYSDRVTEEVVLGLLVNIPPFEIRRIVETVEGGRLYVE